MKKVFAGLMALVMALSMSVTAFADNSVNDMGTGSKTIDVTATYKPATAETIYNVDIKWDEMSFTYTESGSKTWNASTHTYSDSKVSGSWNKTEAKITVTNHSDVAVNVAITYAPTGDSGITGTITNGTATLKAGTVGKPESADKLTATFKISGTPNDTVTTATKIGTITVKLS